MQLLLKFSINFINANPPLPALTVNQMIYERCKNTKLAGKRKTELQQHICKFDLNKTAYFLLKITEKREET